MLIKYNRNYNSGFEFFDPVHLYTQYSNQEPASVVVAEKALYVVKDLVEKIDAYLTKKEVRFDTRNNYAYVGGNRLRVLQEKTWVFKTKEDDINHLHIVSIVTNVQTLREDLEYEMDSLEQDEEGLEEIRNLTSLLVSEQNRVTIMCATSQVDPIFVSELLEHVSSKEFKVAKRNNEVSIIVANDYGLALKNFKVKPINLDITANYNDDFEAVDKVIQSSLNDEKHGIILLHGEKGSGKSTYIRYLAKQIKNKKIIYVPPDLAENLSSPQFVSFLLNHQNSILIIEDCENILQTRKSGGNQAVSNLLNLSDGLLGDALKLQVVCTFNAQLTEIDEALKRPGRLIAEYKFGKLTKDKAQKLVDKLFPADNLHIDKDMSLAEVYNINKQEFVVKNDSQVGFRFNNK